MTNQPPPFFPTQGDQDIRAPVPSLSICICKRVGEAGDVQWVSRRGKTGPERAVERLSTLAEGWDTWEVDDEECVMTEDSKCLVCGARRVYSLTDAIAHAPCDQRLAAVDPDREEGVPLFWDACGAASSAHRNVDRNGG